MSNIEVVLILIRLGLSYYLGLYGFILIREIERCHAVMITNTSMDFPGWIIHRTVVVAVMLYATYLFESLILTII